jgi:hypothetical protein
VAIGHFNDPGLSGLDVDAQVGRLVDLLAPFRGRERRWAVPARERGAGAAEQRLLEWAAPNPETAGSVLYWVGHGWSDGTHAALAHADSPARVGAAGVIPEQLADAIRIRPALAVREEDERGGVGRWS